MTLVTEYAELEQIVADLAALGEDDWVAIDTETTGLHVYQDDRIQGMSLTYPAGSLGALQDWYISVHHDDSVNFPIDWVIEALNECAARQVFHHAEFDWAVIQKECPHYVIPAGRFWDTQTVDWLMDENLPHPLKDAAARAFGDEAKDRQKELKRTMRGRPKGEIYRELRATETWGARGMAQAAREEAQRLHDESVFTWETIPAELTAPYAEMDTNLTWRLREWQEQEMEHMLETDPRPDMQREFDFQVVLYDMICTGIKVNPLAAENLRRDALIRLAELEARFDGVNLGSPQQLAKMIYEDWGVTPTKWTKGGAPSTDKATLEELEGDHPEVEYLLAYRKLSKEVGTYYNGLLERRDREDRIHSAFAMNRTVTGRLSSSAPNLQNIPRADTSPEVRSVFVPEPGLELWEYDLSAAEMRVMAGWAGEEALIAAIEDGTDIHRQTADAIWGPEVVDTNVGFYRTIAKNVGYGYPYGIGPKKVATYIVKGTGLAVGPEHVAQGAEILNGYASTYPKLARLMNGTEREAKRLGFIPLHKPGRFRRYRGPGYRIWETYTALNSIVQGAIGEFMKDVMLAIWPQQGGSSYFRICLQIHDSLVAEVVPGTGEDLRLLLQETADRINPFQMRMLWDAKQWGVDK